MNKAMKFHKCIHLFKKKKKLILLVTLILMFIGGCTSFVIPTTYEAKADVTVNLTTENLGTSVENEGDLLLVEKYNHLMNTNRILNKVNANLEETYDQDDLHRKVKLESKINSQILTIIVKEQSPEKAVKLANTLAFTFKDEIETLKNLDNVKILSEATVNDEKEPLTPVNLLFFGASAIFGFLISYIFVLIQETFLTVLDSSDKIENALKLPVLGVLPFGNGKLINELPSNDIFIENFQMIQRNLMEVLSKNDAKTLLISSAESSDGKSFISANMSIAFAMDQKKTVFVDMDLRRATDHRLFDLPNQVGVTSYALDKSGLSDIIQFTKVTNLSFISAGPVQPKPSEQLSSAKFVQMLKELKEQFDVIIVDTPPLIFADTLSISTMVDGCIYVVNAETSKLEQSIHNIEQLKIVQAPLIGVILNKSKGFQGS
jgi:succinoglycan biosynthesis transport protein ExoP